MNTVAADVAGERGDALNSLVSAAAEDDALLTSIPLSPPILAPLPVLPETLDESRKWKSLVAFDGEIMITDLDVLFGRGGQTNLHIGNLRYRDIISIHRQDYVQAEKVDKPLVAKKIVKAIRTGVNPGRFLKKGDDGKWQTVSDKEAAWKVSQALREKTRWSSMKEETDDEPNSPAPATVAVAFSGAINKPNDSNMKKHGAVDVGTMYLPKKKVKSEKSAVQFFATHLSESAAVPVPTEIAHIAVPLIIGIKGSKMDAILPPNNSDPNSIVFYPRDGDVLFGRGGRTNHHPGNVRLREVVNNYRYSYNQAKKVDKPQVSKMIVSALRRADPPSRFLRHNAETNSWEDVGDKRAAEKVSQTLREKDEDEKKTRQANKLVNTEKMADSAEAKLTTPLLAPIENATTVTV